MVGGYIPAVCGDSMPTVSKEACRTFINTNFYVCDNYNLQSTNLVVQAVMDNSGLNSENKTY